MTYYKNKQYYLELGVIDKKGDFVSGLTVTYKVYKSLDNSLVTSGTLSEIGTSGVYQSSIQFSEVGQYRVEYFTPIPYENMVETINVEELDEQIKRILGLVQENFRTFNQRYDRNNNLIGVLIKIYDNANDCENDTSPIAQYEMTAVFNKKNQLTGYKTKKIA